MKGKVIYAVLLGAALLAGFASFAQIDIEGTVYDRSLNNPIQEVNVYSSRGLHTVSDSSGHYHIRLAQEDSIYFSYLGKKTNGFAVRDIHYPLGFDVSMDVVVRASLPAVLVTHNSYRQDSLENRKLWQKTFDYQKDFGVRNMRLMPMKGITAGVGLDLSIFFNNSAKRSNLVVQKWLINEERENYVDYRWNKRLIAKVTGLDSSRLKEFMRLYRPSYEYIKGFETEYEYCKAIKEQSQDYLIAYGDSTRMVDSTGKGSH